MVNLHFAQPDPHGYIFAPSAIKDGKFVAYPKSGSREGGFPCLMFDVSKAGSLKCFEVKLPIENSFEDHAADYMEHTIERKVALTYNSTLLLAETIKLTNERPFLLLSKICGDATKE